MNRNEMIKFVQGQVINLRQWLENPVPADHQFVVGNNGMWISGVHHNGGSHAFAVTTDPTAAARCTSKNALTIAKSVEEGYKIAKVKCSRSDVKQCLKAAEEFLKLAEELELDSRY